MVQLIVDFFLQHLMDWNGLRATGTAFEITHTTSPIYNKSFDPADTTKLDYETGLFTFLKSLFNTGEELTYILKINLYQCWSNRNGYWSN